MAISGTVQRAAPGLLGFDINTDVTSYATQFAQGGYNYCIRYIPFGTVQDPDLTEAEAEAILAAGLGLMVVQHPPSHFVATGSLGTQFGTRALQYLQDINFPTGMNLWCDLEGVTTPPGDVIDFCTSWYNTVSGGGYVPGLYVGVPSGLNNQQLYDLPFQHYWKAYNAENSIPNRGFQLVQSPQSTHIAGLSYDDDMTHTDDLDGTVLWLASS